MLDALHRTVRLSVLRVFAALLWLLAFAWPGITLARPVVFYRADAPVDGVFGLIAADTELRKPVAAEWLLLPGDAVSVAFGVLLISPVAGAMSLVWIIGTCAVRYGLALLTLASRRRLLAGDIRAMVRDLAVAAQRRTKPISRRR